MSNMFSNCESLSQLDLIKFNTLAVNTMEKMFYSCIKLNTLDLSSFNTINCANFKEMFANIPHIRVTIDSTKGSKMKEQLKDCTNVEFIDK